MSYFKYAIAVILALTVTACTTNNPSGGSESEINTLRIAILVDDGNMEQENAFEGFRIALEDYIGMDVEMITGATHLVGIEAMRAGNLELMWGSPFVYILASQTMDVERLVTTSSPTAINKALFITAQEDIQTVDDLAGRSFAFVTTSSTSGFLYPMYYLIDKHGLSRDEILTPGTLFSDVAFSGSNNGSIMGTVQGDFDAAAVGHIQLNNAINAGVIDSDSLRVLGYTPLIPFPGYIATTTLPESLRRQIQNFLVNWDSDEYSSARWNDAVIRYVIPDEFEINHLRSMVQILDIDLEEQG